MKLKLAEIQGLRFGLEKLSGAKIALGLKFDIYDINEKLDAELKKVNEITKEVLKEMGVEEINPQNPEHKKLYEIFLEKTKDLNDKEVDLKIKKIKFADIEKVEVEENIVPLISKIVER